MEKHIRNFHTHLDRCECDLCGKKLAYQSLEFHMRMHMGNQMVQCPHCPKKITYLTLDKHIQLQHTEGPRLPKKLYKCDVCGKEVTRLGAHMNTHKDKVQCAECKKWYTVTTLPSHKRLMHATVATEINCPYEGCDKKGNKDFIRHHKVTHDPKIKCQAKGCNVEMKKDSYRKHMLKFHPEEWKKEKGAKNCRQQAAKKK